ELKRQIIEKAVKELENIYKKTQYKLLQTQIKTLPSYIDLIESSIKRQEIPQSYLENTWNIISNICLEITAKDLDLIPPDDSKNSPTPIVELVKNEILNTEYKTQQNLPLLSNNKVETEFERLKFLIKKAGKSHESIMSDLTKGSG